jgi:hypothetical protein
MATKKWHAQKCSKSMEGEALATSKKPKQRSLLLICSILVRTSCDIVIN